jgi:hypothetical protein
MVHWFMEVVTGLFSLWAPDFADDELTVWDPLASS